MAGRDSALEKLMKLSSEQGYLLYDDLSDAADEADLSISDVDWLSRALVQRNVSLLDSADEANALQGAAEQQNKIFNDLAHINYEPVYEKVLSYAPEMEGFITDVRNITPARYHEYSYLTDKILSGKLTPEEDHKIRNRMVETHIRMAVKQGLDFYERNIETDLEDDIELACEGAMNAIYNLDFSSEFTSISGIASFGAFRMLQRYAEPLPAPYYPVHFIEAAKAAKNAILSYLSMEEFDGAVRCANQILGCGEEKAIQAVNIYAGYIPIDHIDPTFNAEEQDTEDTDETLLYEDFEQEIMYRQLQLALKKQMDTLTERERDVLTLRFGLHDGVRRSLEDIGIGYGVTRERIRQIETKALRKLHHPSREIKLCDFLE